MSEIITSKINLSQFKHVIEQRKTKDGKMIKVITLPIEANNFFLSEKGNCFIDLIAFGVAPEKRKGEDTHLIKQSLPKALTEKMSEDEKRSMPIIGNHKVWGESFGGGEPEPYKAPGFDGNMGDGNDDLPF